MAGRNRFSTASQGTAAKLGGKNNVLLFPVALWKGLAGGLPMGPLWKTTMLSEVCFSLEVRSLSWDHWRTWILIHHI